MENSSSLQELKAMARILTKSVVSLEKSEIACCGVTMTQCAAIMEIGMGQGLSVVELASRLDLDKSTLSRTVDNLSNLGLVNRITDTEDRRFVSVSLTEQGRAVFTQINTAFDTYLSTVLSAIPPDKREQVHESLTLLVDAFREHRCC